ncbi:MAG: DUF349 domain-containing protein, partial [Bacteroidales bacterium]|nr:DUF349 domain-containing protein [Bacteroidales bacterium]
INQENTVKTEEKEKQDQQEKEKSDTEVKIEETISDKTPEHIQTVGVEGKDDIKIPEIKEEAEPVKTEKGTKKAEGKDNIKTPEIKEEAKLVKSEKDIEKAKDNDKKQDEQAEVNYNDYSKEELTEFLENIVNEKDIISIKSKVALIKVAFLKKNKEENQKNLEEFLSNGGEKDNYTPVEDPIYKKFNEIFNIYKKNKAKYNEELEKTKIKNLEEKKIILEELKILIDSEETLKKTYDDFKTLQEKWKEIGMVPKNEVNNLWQNYHFLVEKFFDKVKINKELRDLDLKKNLESKIKLCEKTEVLLLETSILRSFKQLQKYHEEWKEVGPVALDKKDEIWERFKSATNKINERRREYYAKLQEEQKDNYINKTVLCEKAEQIIAIENTSIKQWQDNTYQINELLNIWKTIGPAPKKQNDEIWERFKTCLDTFFSDKKEYFAKLKEQQVNNYNLKLDLCVQAEAIKDSTDWRNSTKELIDLQKEWKNIGPVPRKFSDKIWKRFRAACDEFFENKSEYFANIQTHEAENFKTKQELIKKVEEHKFGDNKNENLNVLQEFQRKWTEIGHVPIKEKDKLQNEFRDSINKQLDNLKISKIEMQTINYKKKFETFKNFPDAKKIIYNEKNFLINKINNVEGDIKLWENNIGFFAKSKKANVVKDEFEKKINKSKEEILFLKAKLKMLKNS